MKIYIIAGEASGDLHASNLVKALLKEQGQLELRGWGGDLMEAAGVQLVKHYRDLAFMGFWEVAANLRTILRNIRFCKEDIASFQPDLLILVDYPGFNMRIAKWAKEQGIQTAYYISPQIWAWHTSRVHKMARISDEILTILPFEPAFYQGYGYDVAYVGHPLLDVIPQHPADDQFRSRHNLSSKPIIALLPGSRKQEVQRMLAEMAPLGPRFPDYQLVVAGAPSIPRDFYEDILRQYSTPGHEPAVVENKTYDLLQHAEAALVTSGTATLETALFRVPQVVCYKGSAFSYWIARRLVKVPYIALVNLIAEQKIVEELIQKEVHTERLVQALQKILEPGRRQEIREAYERVREKLGGSGASQRAAAAILLKKK